MEHFIPAPPAAITRVLSSFNRRQLEGFVAVAIDLMDFVDGDPDAEHDPFNEGEPAFDPAARAMVNEHPDTDPNHDGEASAWTEGVDQSRRGGHRFLPWELGSSEDAEEDDHGGGEVTEDEPGFDKKSRRIANVHAHGAGCSISDPDYGGEELGEREEPEGPRIVYGVDQSRPVSADNPPIH